LLYDKGGDAHYDTISAFIKSVRGSDPDAALYWLAKMIAAGEDPRFILRRLVVLAGEDIGLADPQGLVVASAAVTAFEFIGMPEGIYPIAEATLYLATAPKSNTTGAYYKAAAEIEKHGIGPVPVHLMDSSRDAKGLGHGVGYQYPHDFPGHYIPQQYLPSNLLGTVFYQPSDQGYEARIAERLEMLRASTRQAQASGQQEKNDDPSTDSTRRK
jgi:putative ATPase